MGGKSSSSLLSPLSPSSRADRGEEQSSGEEHALGGARRVIRGGFMKDMSRGESGNFETVGVE